LLAVDTLEAVDANRVLAAVAVIVLFSVVAHSSVGRRTVTVARQASQR
jgi:hypothetical protein